MSYGIVLSLEAKNKLARFPLPVRRFTLLQLENLAENPTALSKRSEFPYREKSQLFVFHYDHDAKRWEICVMFQYGADEETIHVIAIGFSLVDP